MTSPIRPVFQEGERLTASRLNAAVEYLRSALRRALLGPLSPGVAAGLEIMPAPNGVDMVVQPGLAIDGRGRMLVVQESLVINQAAVEAQVGDLAVGGRYAVNVAINDRYGSFDPCSPHPPRDVIDDVQLTFDKAHPQSTISLLEGANISVIHEVATTAATISAPWSELDPEGRSSRDFGVRLGYVVWGGAAFGQVDPSGRAGVSPRFASLRNSYGEMMMALGREATGARLLGVLARTVFRSGAPVTFQAPVDFQTDLLVKGAATFQKPVSFQDMTGGPLTQAAVVAVDMGSPPAGRASAADPRVFEAAGGRSGGAPGAGGVLAVSMQYDTQLGSTYNAFTHVPHAGFPLAFSPSATITYPELVPYDAATYPAAAGLAAAPSQVVTGVGDLVPLAAFGPIRAMVKYHGASALGPGVELTPDTLNIVAGSVYPLRIAGSGDMVVARTSIEVPVSSSIQPTVVMAVQPYPKP